MVASAKKFANLIMDNASITIGLKVMNWVCYVSIWQQQVPILVVPVADPIKLHFCNP